MKTFHLKEPIRICRSCEREFEAVAPAQLYCQKCREKGRYSIAIPPNLCDLYCAYKREEISGKDNWQEIELSIRARHLLARKIRWDQIDYNLDEWGYREKIATVPFLREKKKVPELKLIPIVAKEEIRYDIYIHSQTGFRKPKRQRVPRTHKFVALEDMGVQEVRELQKRGESK